MNLMIITVFLLIFTVISVKKTFWGLIFISALLPTYLIRFLINEIPFTFLEGMVLIITVLYFIKETIQKTLLNRVKNLRQDKFTFPALLLLTAATISVFAAPDKLAALGLWKAYFIEPILLAFVFVNTVKTRKQLNYIVIALVSSAVIIAFIAIGQFFTGFGIPESYDLPAMRRVTAFYQYPAAVGLFLAPILSLLLSLIIIFISTKKQNSPVDEKNKSCLSISKQWIMIGILSSITLITTLILTRAEGAWMGVLVATFFILMFTKYRFKIIATSLMIVVLLLAIPATRDYLITLLTFQDVSGEVRLVLWQGTFRLIADNPIFGSGLAGFPMLYEEYKEARHIELSLYPHNILLDFWVETGILGLIALILIIFQYLKTGIKTIKTHLEPGTYGLPLLAPMICIIVYGLVDSPYFKNDLAVLFWIFVGIMVVANNLKQSREKKI